MTRAPIPSTIWTPNTIPRAERDMKKKLIRAFCLDLLLVGIGLNVFALFHHVLDLSPKTEPVELVTLTSPEPSAQITGDGTGPVPEEPQRPLTWREEFADKFTDGDVIQTENAYMSGNINVTFSRVEENGILYHLADIYITDIRYLRGGFSHGVYSARSSPISETASLYNAVVALSGDHYGGRYEGLVVRNGVLYRDTRFADVCVLYTDGVMATFADEDFDLEAESEKGIWQVWSFGPMLLDNGQPMTEFNSDVQRANPRSAIGYFEPGHYCFVQVDGRIESSRGMTLEELSQLFADLGCTAAYNLDGGQSSGIVWQGQLQSHPYNRPVSDIIYVSETIGEEEG